MNVKLNRRMLAALLAAVMLLAMPCFAFAGTFPDVAEGVWYEEAVEYCAANGLMSGKEGAFDPNGTATREQCVQTLYNLSGGADVAYEPLFADVNEAAWYAPAVVWGAQNKIVEGMGEGLFGSGKKVSREQMVTFLYRYAAFAGADVTAAAELDGFADSSSVSAYAVDAVRWAVASEIVSGRDQADGSSMLAPKAPIKRSELATIMMNFHKLVNGVQAEGLTGTVMAEGPDMLKYGSIDIDIPADDFLKVFELGDEVTVALEGYDSFNVPVCASYDDVPAGEKLLRVVSGKPYVILAINYGQIAMEEGLIEKAPEGAATAYVVKEGVEFPINVTITAKPTSVTGTVMPEGPDMLKYGSIDIDIPADDFLKIFELGDQVTVALEGYDTFNVPVCASYDDVAAGEQLLRVVSGKDYVILAINYGQIAVQEGLIEKTPEGAATAYAVKEGVEFPINVTISERVTKMEGAVIADGADMLKYGHIDIDIPADDFLKVFALGDQVTVALDGFGTFTVPVCASYDDVAAGEMLLRAVSGKDYVILAINYGQIAVQEGMVEKAPEGSETAYVVKEGVELPCDVTVTLAGTGTGENLIGNLIRTYERTEYPELTDTQYANFRVITTTGMGEGVLYRSSSPINPEIARNAYADAAAKEAGVATFINLADTEAEATSFPGYAESYYSAQNHIFLGLPAAFTTDDFKSGLANGFRFMIENDGPYLVHCSEGKDRAGLTAAILECLMGATYEEVLNDYAETYNNYFSVEEGKQRPLTDEETEAVKAVIVANLKLSFGVEITAETDLAAAANDYMKAIGLTDEEIAALKAKLAK